MTATEAKHLTFTSAINSDFYKRCLEKIHTRCLEGAYDAYIDCKNAQDYNMRNTLEEYFTEQGYSVDHDDDNEGLILRW